MDKLDKYIEKELLPIYTQGGVRRRNPRYTAIQRKIEKARKEGRVGEVKKLYQRLRQEASSDPDDPSYRVFSTRATQIAPLRREDAHNSCSHRSGSIPGV
jgi:hypothetical protein